MSALLKTLSADELPSLWRVPVDRDTIEIVRAIVDDVRARGEQALREHAERLGDIEPGAPLFVAPEELDKALNGLPPEQQSLLARTATRIREFAEAQRRSIKELDVSVPGGRAGHSMAPIERAGCYAPGGRFPLPSSVLMTAVTARAAGVRDVWVASPRPTQITLAAAAVAGVDGLLAAGGAQAIAAMAHGAGRLRSCHAVVGPGNKYVTAAKQLVSGHVAIDMLAGPSELVVLADREADPATVAADLLAQAEHDPEALPILVTTDGELVARVNDELEAQLSDLVTAATAEVAVGQGFAVVVGDIQEGIRVCDELAPEHLEIHVADAQRIAAQCGHYGAAFIGAAAAEVLGDYGAGPNHTLPTGGTARYSGGLSVFNFLRIRTWLRIDDTAAAATLVDDSEQLAKLEGLAAHARSARRRRP